MCENKHFMQLILFNLPNNSGVSTFTLCSFLFSGGEKQRLGEVK